MNPSFSPLTYTIRWETDSQCEPVGSPALPDIPDEVKSSIRALLRHGGHKPSGRGRPASESLAKAVSDGRFPTIHPVVDYFNLLSLNSGFPISVLDAGKLRGETGFRVGLEGESYIFNPSGQELSVKGLLLLFDEDGPTGSPVKDAQRTKVDEETQEFFVVVWGTSELADRLSLLDSEVKAWANRHHLECV